MSLLYVINLDVCDVVDKLKLKALAEIRELPVPQANGKLPDAAAQLQVRVLLANFDPDADTKSFTFWFNFVNMEHLS